MARALRIKKHTFIPMLTPNDSTNQGGRFASDAGKFGSPIFEFLQRCRNRRNIKQMRAFFKEHSLDYHPYRDSERGYFKHKARNTYFASIPTDSLENAAILIDPDVGLETKGRSWKERPDQYVMFKEVAYVVREASGKSVILLFQFLQPDANKRKGDLQCKAQRLRRELEATCGPWQPIPWVAELQNGRDGGVLPRELAFFIVAAGRYSQSAIEKVVRNYVKSRRLVSSLK